MDLSKRRQRIWNALYAPVKAVMSRRFGYTFDRIDQKAPYLLIANHTTNVLDVFFTALATDRTPLVFVGSEHLMRSALGRFVRKNMGYISRPKGASALSTVREILTTLREGTPVCLFAEGNCSWDGRNIPVVEGTGTLARACGVPLVTYRIEGGYLSRPRWSRSLRMGSTRGRLVGVYSPEALKGMSSGEVNALIDRDIREDAWERQQKEPQPRKCRRPAEHLERMLYLCPSCRRAGTLISRKDTVSCACGLSIKCAATGYLEPASPFKTIVQWEDWQKAALAAGDFVRESDEILFSDGNCTLTKLDGDGARPIASGRLAQRDGLLDIGGREFKLGDISEMDMVKWDRLLFTSGDGYWQVRAKGRTNLRKYLGIWQACHARDKANNDK